jgi:hypothetical protein
MKSFFRSAFFTILFLIPVFGVLGYGFVGSFGCGLGGGNDFSCRVIVPLFWICGIISLGLAFALGPCVALRKRVKTVAVIYIVAVIFAPVTFFMYLQVLPESFKDEVLEGRTEERCFAMSGTERESCLLEVFRTRLLSGPGDISWCEQVNDPVAKIRCQSDVKASRGDGSLCATLTHEYPSGHHGYPGQSSAEKIALNERDFCYNTATFALDNTYVNFNYGDYRYGYDESKCAAESREITKNYCYLRIERCDLISDSTMSRDCLARKEAYLRNSVDSSKRNSLPSLPVR